MPLALAPVCSDRALRVALTRHYQLIVALPRRAKILNQQRELRDLLHKLPIRPALLILGDPPQQALQCLANDLGRLTTALILLPHTDPTTSDLDVTETIDTLRIPVLQLRNDWSAEKAMCSHFNVEHWDSAMNSILDFLDYRVALGLPT